MTYSFVGDLILQDLEKYNDEPFKEIVSIFEDTELVINLESPFVDETCDIPLKNKVTLCQVENAVKYLKQLNPFLTSISNNHINDYGNESVNLTKDILKQNDFDYFGAGEEKDNSHIKIYDEDKIIFITYTTRETDLTGGYLFADKNMQGPKDISFSEIKELREKYADFKLVLYIHWGVEYIPLPLPLQREVAYELIESGIDLIVGHHAHIIQPYEVYKDKYIFYSLGNFLFADIEFFLKGKKQQIKQESYMKEGLICQFDIQNNKLIKLIKVQRDEKCTLAIKELYDSQLKEKNNLLYKLKYNYLKFRKKYSELQPLLPKVKKKALNIFYSKLNDYWYSKFRFIKSHGYIPNFKKPRSFSEKINHIKLYKIDELREKIVDRIWVRDYVKQKAPECKLIENLWVGKEFTKEIWNNLPQEFVIKGNHGSGMVKVVDKNKDNFEQIRQFANIWMSNDYAKVGREWFYNKVEPLIIVEEKLKFNNDVPPDFKFFCFNGQIKMIQVSSEKSINHSINLYDENFNEFKEHLALFPKGKIIDTPRLFEEGKNIATKLANDFDFIRVDLYILENNVYFGELTNIPGNGFDKYSSKEFDFKLGKKLVLND